VHDPVLEVAVLPEGGDVGGVVGVPVLVLGAGQRVQVDDRVDAVPGSPKNWVSRRSKNRSARSSPMTLRTSRRISVSLAAYPVMKFSILSQPPRQTPRRRSGSPSGPRNSDPDVRITGSWVDIGCPPRKFR
jgi:hypothetical protein